MGAKLSGADIWRSGLSGAIYDEHTKWPDGFDPKEVGAELIQLRREDDQKA